MRLILRLALLLFLAGAAGACRRRDAAFPGEKSAGEARLVAVDASVYRGLMEMLGIGDRCVDFSDDAKVDAEKLVASGADALMLSAYDGIDTEKYRRTGIRVIECTDFNETTALGRAAWMVRYGEALGVKDRADSLFGVVKTRYDSLRRNVPRHAPKKKVMFDLVYGGIWYQPTKNNATGNITTDAGGVLPFPEGGRNGVAALSKERMLAAGADADVWIIRYGSKEDLTLEKLGNADPAYRQFKAFRSGNVWACNTAKTAYFDEAPFRPDYLLEDIVHILHPGQYPDYVPRYFVKVR